MSSHDLLIIVLFIGILVAFTPLLGKWLANVLQGKRSWLSPVLGPVERCTYRVAGVDPSREMDWKKYLTAVLLFNAAGFLILFLSLLCQKWLPLNPAGTENMRWDIALNTAISFMTNTNWQFYSGEGPEGISYFVQMTGLGVQNFVSAATGIAVMAALIRGLKRKCASTLGNFWADLTRSTLYFLIPISVVVALLLVSQGVVQSFDGPATVPGMDGVEQVIPNGPAASQVAIKQLGTNGGGFFGNNSTHPFENPTPFSNMIEMLSLLLIGCACPYAYGVMIGKKRQGWIIFGAMMLLLVTTIGLSQWAEHTGNPLFPGMEMLEGKEVRLGVTNSSLWSVATTASSNGSVNCMHCSMSPLGGGIALFNMLLGEVIFGGLGCGLYGMLMFAMITVFLCGLMVGRTPEFLGKKIEAREVRWSMVGVLLPGITVLLMSGLAAATEVGRESDLQCRTPRADGNPVLLRFPGREQRERLCRPGCGGYAFLFRAGRPGDAAGPLRSHHSGDDHCGQHGIQENRASGPGHHGDGQPDVHGSAGGRGADCRRPHLLPGPGPGAHSGASAPVFGNHAVRSIHQQTRFYDDERRKKESILV